MKKYLNILFALALILAGILGYRSNRPRTLDKCFPEGVWEKAEVTAVIPEEGELGDVFELTMTPEELQEAAKDITVFNQSKIKVWNCDRVHLQIEVAGETLWAEVGEDGSIALSPAKTGETEYWRATDGEFYQLLTDR